MPSLILNPIVQITIAVLLVADFARAKPNFIVVQPDDFYFFEEWNPPGQFDGGESLNRFPRNSDGLPYINRIRKGGLEMKNAYAASAMCGTSRYSTITGRYPSRSAYGRVYDKNNFLRDVRIPATKLEDISGVDDPKDCSENNIAALLQRNGYRTGVTGKWHLTSDDGGAYSYGRIQNDVRRCGFDFAEAVYKENLRGDWYGDATHNMEHVTSEAFKFIEEAVEEQDKPFFLYFNPTVPHGSGDVTDALENSDCRDTVGGRLNKSPSIRYGMTADFGGDCKAYRQSVLERGGRDDDKLAGAVWVDDAIGSLFQLLENLGIVDNTFFLFQLDHGEYTKASLFEGGTRIPQFVHYPDLFSSGSTFEGLVSTIDVAATIADVAGVPDNNLYSMDGKSWKSEVVNGNNAWSRENDRCLFFEQAFDRSVRCGCYKYTVLEDTQSSSTAKVARRVGVSISNDNYYNLCDDAGSYINAPEISPEKRSTSLTDFLKSELEAKIECHLSRTIPSNDPKYNQICEGALDGFEGVPQTSSPTRTQTPKPTKLPTNKPTPQPSRQPSTIKPLPVSGYLMEAPTDTDEIIDFFNETDDLFDFNITDFAGMICDDDAEYLYNGMDGRDCRWVIESDRCDREDPETKFHIGKSFCPSSCSYCEGDDNCLDNLYFQWYGRQGFGCIWLLDNERCESIRDAAHGTSVHLGRRYCPQSCGYCPVDDEISEISMVNGSL